MCVCMFVCICVCLRSFNPALWLPHNNKPVCVCVVIEELQKMYADGSFPRLTKSTVVLWAEPEPWPIPGSYPLSYFFVQYHMNSFINGKVGNYDTLQVIHSNEQCRPTSCNIFYLCSANRRTSKVQKLLKVD